MGNRSKGAKEGIAKPGILRVPNVGLLVDPEAGRRSIIAPEVARLNPAERRPGAGSPAILQGTQLTQKQRFDAP